MQMVFFTPLSKCLSLVYRIWPLLFSKEFPFFVVLSCLGVVILCLRSCFACSSLFFSDFCLIVTVKNHCYHFVSFCSHCISFWLYFCLFMAVLSLFVVVLCLRDFLTPLSNLCKSFILYFQCRFVVLLLGWNLWKVLIWTSLSPEAFVYFEFI